MLHGGKVSRLSGRSLELDVNHPGAVVVGHISFFTEVDVVSDVFDNEQYLVAGWGFAQIVAQYYYIDGRLICAARSVEFKNLQSTRCRCPLRLDPRNFVVLTTSVMPVAHQSWKSCECPLTPIIASSYLTVGANRHHFSSSFLFWRYRNGSPGGKIGVPKGEVS